MKKPTTGQINSFILRKILYTFHDVVNTFTCILEVCKARLAKTDRNHAFSNKEWFDMYKSKPVTGNEGTWSAIVGRFLQWCDSFPFQLSVTRHTTFILLRLIYRYTFYCSAITYFTKTKKCTGTHV